jgi:hypothetical protein
MDKATNTISRAVIDGPWVKISLMGAPLHVE